MQLTTLFDKSFVYFLLSISENWSSPEVVNDVYSIKSTPKQDIVSDIRPVVFWHGLGDNFNSSFMHRASEILETHYPGIFVLPVSLAETPKDDQKKSIFGNANVELETVCDDLKARPELEGGFDAVGFSQGGLFLRALIERCSDLKVHNLITFGSPHNGVSELPLCENPSDWVCKSRNALLKKQVWYDTVQRSVIPAQYFRDPFAYSSYLEHSNFLADINNEREEFNSTYKENFQSINKLVLITFTQDTTLVPKDSASFFDVDGETGDVIGFENTRIYQDDLIGLKSLHAENKIEFLNIDEDHMTITDEFFEDISIKFLGTFQ